MTTPKNTLESQVNPPKQAGPVAGFAALVDRYLDGLEMEVRTKSRLPIPPLDQRRQKPLPPQEELDLHGLTTPEAEKAIKRFVSGCRELRLTTLRIITGKGLHSQGPPVLPPVAEATLETLKEDKKVASFHWEKKRHKRGGALIVYLP
ncbi:Smr/MutS family protein [Desulfurivibrio dismutans]|uniref:Smr/MutS family protein n=1 Tax=Desulfurivibrio dismutans TaxID=1398908 RepID=UPI0023DCE775|nr:Smr/MutS family protein [Desulfurivibrio alkaliphilus]MDF1614131.1 Smr/MutS family protein [Desulfurivibrio alkaliphilus]